MQKPFVQVLKLTRKKNKPGAAHSDPTWEQVETMLRALNHEGPGRIELLDAAERVRMTVRGEPGAFHVGVSIDDVEFHFYSNGPAEADDELTEVAWDAVPEDQVCKDFDLVMTIARAFYEKGE